MEITDKTTVADRVREVEAAHILQVYRRPPVVFTHGQGSRLYDADGQPYLDLVSGIGVASLGHAHPKLAQALAEQAHVLLHTSNLYYHPLQGELASRLARLSGLARAFFCNSGTEAMEACLKFSRRYWHTRGQPQRTKFVALEHAFHGRTFGSLSVTWGEPYRTPFQPLLDGVTFVPPNDVERLRTAVSTDTAAIIVEPIQGEGGIRPLTREFTQAIDDLCRQTGTLLIADEVQSGLGRTGHAFYSPILGLAPHLMALGKALGGGMPVAAALLAEDVAGAMSFGDHGSTYGGNLLACRAALVFLDELEGGLLAHVRAVGTRLEQGLRALARLPGVVDVRGAGLMWGVELEGEAATRVVEAALRRRLLVNRTAGTVVRLRPPLSSTESDVDEALELLGKAIAEGLEKAS
jgi:predicted acetylornithine/succinylornithine family transaminase